MLCEFKKRKTKDGVRCCILHPATCPDTHQVYLLIHTYQHLHLLGSMLGRSLRTKKATYVESKCRSVFWSQGDTDGDPRTYDRAGRSYLFDIDFSYLNRQCEIKWTVDARHAGNFTRYLVSVLLSFYHVSCSTLMLIEPQLRSELCSRTCLHQPKQVGYAIARDFHQNGRCIRPRANIQLHW
jgi:hypothetical protein